MQDTSLNLLFAGHDTSASAIMLAMRHLKLQPHILNRLREEQQQVSRCSGWMPFVPSPLLLPLTPTLPFLTPCLHKDVCGGFRVRATVDNKQRCLTTTSIGTSSSIQNLVLSSGV